MAEKSLSCVSCGATNPASQERCNDCGATLDKMVAITTRRTHGDVEVPAFGVPWFATALGFYVVVLGVVILGLPFVLKTYDPQGFPGIALSIATWFVGGLITGRLSPYRTYLESFLAATITACLIIPYIASISDVRAMDTASYLIGGAAGALAAGLGSFLGERKEDAPSAASAVAR